MMNRGSRDDRHAAGKDPLWWKADVCGVRRYGSPAAIMNDRFGAIC